MTILQPKIQDLAIIGDRRTCAYTDKQANIVWYCPGRFDQPSVFASLLDIENGGAWKIIAEGLTFKERHYTGDSAILNTYLLHTAGALQVEDWMPMGTAFTGICRSLSEAPVDLQLVLQPKPDYARGEVELLLQDNTASINGTLFLSASHPLQLQGDTICCAVPEGEKSWFVLADQEFKAEEQLLEEARKATLQEWKQISRHITYHGAYQKEVRNSLRVLRMMTFAENGGIIAAGTTSLPEVPEGDRNYDYRYVWLRDAAMIASALTRAGSDGEEERKFLDFICNALHHIDKPVVPFLPLILSQPLARRSYITLQAIRQACLSG
ncbi:hypothetical protein GCM10028895_15550 [Pontibacter rugosus]